MMTMMMMEFISPRLTYDGVVSLSTRRLRHTQIHLSIIKSQRWLVVWYDWRIICVKSDITAAMWVELWQLWRIEVRIDARIVLLGQSWRKFACAIGFFLLILSLMIRSASGDDSRSHYLLMPRVLLTKCCRRSRRV